MQQHWPSASATNLKQCQKRISPAQAKQDLEHSLNLHTCPFGLKSWILHDVWTGIRILVCLQAMVQMSYCEVHGTYWRRSFPMRLQAPRPSRESNQNPLATETQALRTLDSSTQQCVVCLRRCLRILRILSRCANIILSSFYQKHFRRVEQEERTHACLLQISCMVPHAHL